MDEKPIPFWQKLLLWTGLVVLCALVDLIVLLGITFGILYFLVWVAS